MSNSNVLGIMVVHFLVGAACSNRPAEFTPKNSYLSDTSVQAVISKSSSLSDSDDYDCKSPSLVNTNRSLCGTSSPGNSGIGLANASSQKKLEETFKPDAESMGNCAPYFQKKLLDAKISGSMNDLFTDGNSSMAFKVTGNNNSLNINYKNQNTSDKKTVFEGLCIFVAGNQSKVVVSIKDVLLKRIVVVARGNQAKIDIKIEGAGDLGEVVFDGKGNSPELEISAPATFPCKDRLKSTAKESGVCKVTS